MSLPSRFVLIFFGLANRETDSTYSGINFKKKLEFFFMNYKQLLKSKMKLKNDYPMKTEPICPTIPT